MWIVGIKDLPVTMLILENYLLQYRSDEEEYEGGDLVFHLNNEEKLAPKSKGTIIFFESDMMK